jgi:hypothetical protein
VKHPAEFYMKYLLIQDPQVLDAQLLKKISDWGILSPDEKYLGFLRQRHPASTPSTSPTDLPCATCGSKGSTRSSTPPPA